MTNNDRKEHIAQQLENCSRIMREGELIEMPENLWLKLENSIDHLSKTISHIIK